MPILELSDGFEEKVLEMAAHSPAAAMMRLSLEVDRQLRLILAVIDRLKDYAGKSPSEALDLIAQTAVGSAIPSELRDTLDNYWVLRNQVVHSGASSSVFALRAVDYGLRIVRMLQSIPRPSFIVTANVPIFTDRECVQPRRDVQGVLLNLFGSNGENHGRHIFPTRRKYVAGQSVSWEWDRAGIGWGATWYRDLESDKPKSAWSESLEFIGRPLDEI
jgi:hypothetical protein